LIKKSNQKKSRLQRILGLLFFVLPNYLFIFCSPKKRTKKGRPQIFFGINIFQKISDGIDRLTATWVKFPGYLKTSALTQNSQTPIKIQTSIDFKKLEKQWWVGKPEMVRNFGQTVAPIRLV
jgi:hypothetical protein